MKKRVLNLVLCLVFAVVLCMAFSACGDSGEEQTSDSDQVKTEETEPEVEEVSIEDAQIEEEIIEEEENAEGSSINPSTKYEDFIGTWKTTTELGDENFGGYTVTFNEDKTFNAVVTGEEETGKCTFEKGVLTIQNEVMNDQFWFNQDGVMIVQSEQGAMSILREAE